MRLSAATLLTLGLVPTALGAPAPAPLPNAELPKRQTPGAGSMFDYVEANSRKGGGFLPQRVKVNTVDIPPPIATYTPWLFRFPGTNVHAPGIGIPPLLTLAAERPDYKEAMRSPETQPTLPVPDPSVPANATCEYTYVNVFGGAENKGAHLWANGQGDNLVPVDVLQGGIGDCGMGASILALVTSGYLGYIRQSILQLYAPPLLGGGGAKMSFNFRSGNDTDVVFVDYALPKLSPKNTAPGCWDYLGFQAVADGNPNADGSNRPASSCHFSRKPSPSGSITATAWAAGPP